MNLQESFGKGAFKGGETSDALWNSFQDLLPTWFRDSLITPNADRLFFGCIPPAILLQVVVVLIVPLLIAVVEAKLNDLPTSAKNFYNRISGWYSRTIIHVISSDYYFNLRRNDVNQHLQSAIMLYLGKRKKCTYRTGAVELVRVAAEAEATSERCALDRSSTELEQLHITNLPSRGNWELVDEKIFFKCTQENVDGSSLYEKRTKITFHVASTGDHAKRNVKEFVDRCYEEYTELLRRNEDKARYLFQLQVGTKTKNDEGMPVPAVFKRYKLSDEKTFESLFFPQKTQICTLIDDFLQRRGKFAIDGFPQKLGLLLHGPPGTGKTSFVKALATYTNRHIVSVPLGKINTNQELYDIMFERNFPCINGTGDHTSYTFDDLIFLMEEIDASTNIVKSRDSASDNGNGTDINTALLQPQAAGDVNSTRKVFESDIFKKELEELKRDEAVALCKSSTSTMDAVGGESSRKQVCVVSPHHGKTGKSFRNKERSNEGSSGNSDDDDDEPRSKKYHVPGGASTSGRFDMLTDMVGPRLLLQSADQLDLAGLLNILDGVVDSPGRIVILTTNHPEKLDAALIRPGRINTKIHLNYILLPQIIEMLDHHYGTLSQEQQSHVEKGWAFKFNQDCDFEMTPAEVEQLCAEHDDLGSFLSGLAKFPSLVETAGS